VVILPLVLEKNAGVIARAGRRINGDTRSSSSSHERVSEAAWSELELS
jgi:hypothetical protein